MSERIQQRRKAVTVLESNRTDGGYVPSVVYEGDPLVYDLIGHGEFARPWVWGPSLTQAREQAEQANSLLGHTPEDVNVIVRSQVQAALARKLSD